MLAKYLKRPGSGRYNRPLALHEMAELVDGARVSPAPFPEVPRRPTITLAERSKSTTDEIIHIRSPDRLDCQSLRSQVLEKAL
jgi:hypothetical protein